MTFITNQGQQSITSIVTDRTHATSLNESNFGTHQLWEKAIYIDSFENYK